VASAGATAPAGMALTWFRSWGAVQVFPSAVEHACSLELPSANSAYSRLLRTARDGEVRLCGAMVTGPVQLAPSGAEHTTAASPLLGTNAAYSCPLNAASAGAPYLLAWATPLTAMLMGALHATGGTKAAFQATGAHGRAAARRDERHVHLILESGQRRRGAARRA